MHIEVQVALNFVISYLYNKLPRRRVNIFGEELEKALKDKFQGHWYPEKPFKGSAFRCIKTGDPVDKVLERAARESGVPIQDILENLPQDLAVWVDPGEVSYRIGEKGAVKVLFSEKGDPQDESSADREVTKTFNPEAQCFKPIDSVSSSLSNLRLSPKSSPFSAPPLSAVLPVTVSLPQAGNTSVTVSSGQAVNGSIANNLLSRSSAPSPTSVANSSYKGSPSPIPSFIPRTTTPLTFTTATFAQTKFGSTKLKTSCKRANRDQLQTPEFDVTPSRSSNPSRPFPSRMSPTEFSNYIKQRAMQQQLHQQHAAHHSPNGRALSPDPSAYYFSHNPYAPQFPHRSMFDTSNQFLGATDLYPGKLAFDHTAGGPLGPFYPNSGPLNAPPTTPTTPQDTNKLLDNWPYPTASQYQHLLVAN